MESGNGTRQDWMYHMRPRGVGFKGGRGDFFFADLVSGIWGSEMLLLMVVG